MKLCKQTMINAYNWTSFSPEKRGEYDFKYYSELLEADLNSLNSQGSAGNYEAKFIERVMAIYARQARCASPMITGPANFNNRRNGKAWDSRDNALKEFDVWRTRYFKAVNRVRTLSPEEEIDKTLEELERMEIKHEFYKAMNKIKDIEAKKAFAIENDMLKVFEYWNDYNHTIPSFHLTNHNNKIKARRQKLETMKKRIETKESFDGMKFEGGEITIENDRVCIKHDEKPAREVIEKLKSKGFRWSPRTLAWVRKHTQNALWDAQNIVKVGK